MDNKAAVIAIINDVIKFLEKLCESKLPNSLENLRLNLLERSKNLINVNEPYLEMNVGKGFELFKNDAVKDNQSVYTDADDLSTTKISTDEYEIFEDDVSLNDRKSTTCNDNEQNLRLLYSYYTIEETKSRSIKFGPLFKKEERKLFGIQLFDQFHEILIGLVNHHLLAYRSKQDQQPFEIISIQGYSARPAPTIPIKDARRKTSAFEIFAPGNVTYQFIARNLEEMKKWITVICTAGAGVSNNSCTTSTPVSSTSSNKYHNLPKTDDVEYYDVGVVIKNDNTALSSQEPKTISTNNNISSSNNNSSSISISNNNKQIVSSSPPTLPTRTPRQLPSLPIDSINQPVFNSNSLSPSDDTDDIYYKIQDDNSYQNLYKNSILINTKNNVNKIDESKEKIISEIQEVIQVKNNDESNQLNGDDDNKTIKSKSFKKKNFLSKMRTKSKGKVDKCELKIKFKGQKKIKVKKDDKKSEEVVKESENKHLIEESEAISYDNVQCKSSHFNGNCVTISSSCGGADNSNGTVVDNNLEEYLVPPPPRPVVEPIEIKTEEIYDDIGEVLNEVNKMYENSCVESDKKSNNNLSQNSDEINKSFEEVEHYKVPRPQSLINPIEVYDDIAILSSNIKNISESSNSSSEKNSTYITKTWNRFKKPKELSLLKKKELKI